MRLFPTEWHLKRMSPGCLTMSTRSSHGTANEQATVSFNIWVRCAAQSPLAHLAPLAMIHSLCSIAPAEACLVVAVALLVRFTHADGCCVDAAEKQSSDEEQHDRSSSLGKGCAMSPPYSTVQYRYGTVLYTILLLYRIII